MPGEDPGNMNTWSKQQQSDVAESAKVPRSVHTTIETSVSKKNTTTVVCYHTIVYHAMVYWSWLVPGGLMTVGGGAGFFRALPDILLSVDVFEGGGWCSV